MVELYIENNKVDINQDLAMMLTFAIDDINPLENKNNFSSRNTNFSKTVIVPGTQNNNRVFGNIFEFQIRNPYNEDDDNVGINFNPFVSARVLAFQNGIQVFKGICKVLTITKLLGTVEYEVSLTGELGGVISKLGTKKLEDLDFSAYDCNWNASTISSSWNTASAGSGVYFGLTDYALATVDRDNFTFRAFKPALYIAEYIKKMFEGIGYTYDFPLLSTTRFKSLVSPSNQKEVYRKDTHLLEITKTTLQGVTSPSTTKIAFDLKDGGGFTANLAKTEFTSITDPISLLFTVNLSGGYDGTCVLAIKVDGATIRSYSRVYNQPFVFSEQFSTVINTGGVLTIELICFSGSAYINSGSIKVETNIPVNTIVQYDGQIKINETIPKNILQKDFLTSIIKLFNLYVYEDPKKSQHVVIKPFPDFYSTDPADSRQLTVDYSKPIIITPLSEINSRYYNFKFKDDTNDLFLSTYKKRYNQGFGDYQLDTGYEFTEDKGELEVIFSPTVLVGYGGHDKIYPTIIGNTVDQKIDFNIRILQAKKITGVSSWSILDESFAVVGTYTDYGYQGNYDDPDVPANDIHFGVPKELYFTLLSGAVNVTQFNVYWSTYFSEILDKDSKLVTVSALLKEGDIYNLDFSKLIYFEGCLWRLNKIIDWNATKPDFCKVELLKVINVVN